MRKPPATARTARSGCPRYSTPKSATCAVTIQSSLAVAIPVFLALMLAIVTYADIAVLQRMRNLPIVTAFAKISEVTVGLHMPLEEDFWHIGAPELWLL